MALLRTMARTAVVAGTATSVSNRVSRRQAARWSAQAEARPPTPETPPVAGSDRLDQLQQLAQLKESGVLTEAEFEAEKARILGR